MKLKFKVYFGRKKNVRENIFHVQLPIKSSCLTNIYSYDVHIVEKTSKYNLDDRYINK